MTSKDVRLGAFVITFRRPEVLRSTLKLILGQTYPPDRVLVVDNGDCSDSKEIASELGLAYHSFPENRGPAGAAEYATRRLADEGYDWIYWGDEDNPPLFDDIFERIMRGAVSAPSDVAGLGEVGARFDWSRGIITRPPTSELEAPFIEVDYIAGNSQLILRREVVYEVGTPDGRLFFGGYEPEYGLRVRRAGYRFLVEGSLLYRAREHWGRLGAINTRHLVSPYPERLLWRRYYRTRNYIYYMQYVFGRGDLALRQVGKALVRSIFSFARGPRYAWKFLEMETRGVCDGYLQRLGRTVVPCPKRANE